MRHIDAHPQEEEAQPRERQQPGENGIRSIGLTDVCETAKQELNDNTPEWSTLFVNVHQELRTHASCCEGLHGPRRAISTAICHADDRDRDDRVEDRR